MLAWDRTDYTNKFSREFHVCSTAGVYSDLCRKYGSDNVFYGSNQTPLVNALAQVMANRNDAVVVHPGTYTTTNVATDGIAMTISNGCTIIGSTKSAADVNIVAESDCGLFSVAAAADGTKFKHLMITPDTSSTTPQDGIVVVAGCVGVVVEDCIFVGADKATVAIDSEGDRLQIRRTRFEDFKYAVQSNGAYSVFEKNYFNSDNVAAVGLELTAGNWCEVHRNIFDVSGGTGDTGLKIAAACLLGSATYNVFHASCNDPINPVSGTTMTFKGNELTGTTGTIAYIVT